MINESFAFLLLIIYLASGNQLCLTILNNSFNYEETNHLDVYPIMFFIIRSL